MGERGSRREGVGNGDIWRGGESGRVVLERTNVLTAELEIIKVKKYLTLT